MNDTRGLAFRSYLASPLNAVLRGWLPLLVFALLIGTWEGAARLSLVDPMMLPAPSDIAANFIDGFASGIYGHNLQVTLFQALSGFGWPAPSASASAPSRPFPNVSPAPSSRS